MLRSLIATELKFKVDTMIYVRLSILPWLILPICNTQVSCFGRSKGRFKFHRVTHALTSADQSSSETDEQVKRSIQTVIHPLVSADQISSECDLETNEKVKRSIQRVTHPLTSADKSSSESILKQMRRSKGQFINFCRPKQFGI